jgi:predicted RNase H-like nuclease (RuvC/YqgF family)
MFCHLATYTYFCPEFNFEMTEEQHKLLGVFETRIRQLMILCEDLRDENKTLKAKINRLEDSYSILSEENKVIKNKYDNLKMARIISVKQDDFKSAKNRLSKLVREVDKCIALLNE